MEFCGKAFPPSMGDVFKRIQRATKVTPNLWKGNTLSTLPEVVEKGLIPIPHLIFIDGGHSVETIGSDWDSIQPIIGPETVIIFDDWFQPPKEKVGSRSILENLAPEWKVEVFVIDFRERQA